MDKRNTDISPYDTIDSHLIEHKIITVFCIYNETNY